MRTTVAIDPDLQAKVQRLARERGISFRRALNDVLRRGLEAGGGKPQLYRVPVRRLGLRPGIDLDKAHAYAAELEDEETVRKLELRK